MSSFSEQKENLLQEVAKLQHRYELSETVGADYFEPGMMEYLGQSYGVYDDAAGILTLRFESRGTRYDGRTEQIEKVSVGDAVQIERDCDNPYNSNNFELRTLKGHSIGCMPAELCNVIAPLYDDGLLVFERSVVSFVEPISKRSRHAKQAVLFVELVCRMKTE